MWLPGVMELWTLKVIPVSESAWRISEELQVMSISSFRIKIGCGPISGWQKWVPQGDVSFGLLIKSQMVVETSNGGAKSDQPLQKKVTGWDCSGCKD